MTGQRRRPGRTYKAAHPLEFVPRHCGGTSCMHAHPGEKPLPTTQGRTR